jgi:SPP1 gp7 family putative phage head morphogenesis protein
VNIGFQELVKMLDKAMPDVGTVVDFFDVPTGDAFDVPPIRAIAYFANKGLKPTFSYADMLGAEHDRAFTIAKMMDVDMLGQMRASLDSALANGTPFREWQQTVLAQLQAGGWAGRKAVVDKLTGQTVVTEISAPWRLETIFRTNLQTAYARGQQEMIDSQADIAPFLMYDAVDDHRTRPSHRARDGTILPVGYPWWKRNTPPLGYNCRCGVIQLDRYQIESMGLNVSTKPPALDDLPWTNPRTGEKSAWPDGVDPGFGRKDDALGRLLAEKIAQLPPDMRVGIDPQEKQRAIAAAMSYGDDVLDTSDRATQAMLKAATVRARQAQAQLTAQATIDAIGKGGTGWEKAALAELEASAEWRALSATERLRDLRRQARELERRA